MMSLVLNPLNYGLQVMNYVLINPLSSSSMPAVFLICVCGVLGPAVLPAEPLP